MHCVSSHDHLQMRTIIIYCVYHETWHEGINYCTLYWGLTVHEVAEANVSQNDFKLIIVAFGGILMIFYHIRLEGFNYCVLYWELTVHEEAEANVSKHDFELL